MVDVIGTNAVANMIQQSGLSRFTINRSGTAKGTVPVYEYLKGGNISGTVEAFKNWANTIQAGGDNVNEYEILLFEVVEDVSEDQMEVKRTKAKSGKMKFTFQLSNRAGIGVLNGTPQPTQNVSELVQMAVAQALAERDKADLMAKIKTLEDRLNEFEEEEDDDEIGADQNDQLSGLLGTLMPMITGKKKDVVVNGVEEQEHKKVSPEQLSNINKAVRILYRYDDQLDTDLLKLAAVAQSNPQQFSFLLNALRNM